MYRIAIAIICCIGIGIPSANAYDSSNTNPIWSAESAAARFWGNWPCHHSIIIVSALPAEAPKPLAAMWAPLLSPDQWDKVSYCPIYINTGFWPTIESEIYGYEDFCKLMVHEFGHLWGLPDTGMVSGTVEYEIPERAIVPQCEHYMLRYNHHIIREDQPFIYTRLSYK